MEYFTGTGRTKAEIEAFEGYFRAQGLFGVPKSGDIDYSQVVKLDLGNVTPSLAGPKRPQDRIELGKVASQFESLFSKPNAENGFNQSAAVFHTRHLARASGIPLPAKAPIAPPTALGAPRQVIEMEGSRPTLAAGHSPLAASVAVPVGKGSDITIGNGDVLIAAITSCTNTSNPSVLLAAGPAGQKGRGGRAQGQAAHQDQPGPRLAHRHRIPDRDRLLPYLEKLGFAVAGYGCTTCIGNAGDLTPELNEVITKNDLICAAVLSGNRNFEARIHPNLKANFLQPAAGGGLRDCRHGEP